MAENETIVSRLTPPGRGAVAVIIVSGHLATAAVGQSFHSRRYQRVDDIPFYHIAVGNWRGPDRVAGRGEELIICRRSATEIEVHPHGGSACIERVVGDLVQAGCREVDWQTWCTMSERDSIRNAARIALAEARTARTAHVLLDQYNGALQRAIQSILSSLQRDDPTSALEQCDELLRWSDLGRHLTRPWRVVLTGAPNVGKSSLLNRLVGFGRAIVSAEPGTTRDVLTAATALDGWPMEFRDTAGVHDAVNQIEKSAIELTRCEIQRADLVLFVQDIRSASGHPMEWSEVLGSELPIPSRLLSVMNKFDLAGQPLPSSSCRRHQVATSATQGTGIRLLTQRIVAALVPHPPPAGTAIPWSDEQVSWLTTVRDRIEDGAWKTIDVERCHPRPGHDARLP